MYTLLLAACAVHAVRLSQGLSPAAGLLAVVAVRRPTKAPRGMHPTWRECDKCVSAISA